MPYRIRPLVAVVSLALAFPVLAAKPQKSAAPKKEAPVAQSAELELAHNFSAGGAERLQALIDRFNAENKDGAIKLVRLEKGAKPAVLNLIRHHDMAEILNANAKFKPVYQVMKDAKVSFNANEISNDLRAGSVDEKGRVVSLPIAYSTPVLFYNKNAFRKAGLDADKPPLTWFEMQGMLDKLQEAGYSCPYTTSWPTWVHIDNVSALSGVQSVSDKGLLTFNGLPQVKHIAMMATWTKANYFRLFGRKDEANEKFNNGECAMITTDSWEHTAFREAKGVELGVAPLPYHEDVYGGRQNTLADGASLWVGAGYSANDYKVAAKWISFLLKPEMQVEIVRTYGQLPLTSAARAAARNKILRDRDQSLEVAYASIRGSGSKFPLRVANMDRVRLITDEELEAVWANKKPAKAALDTAVSRGNAVISANPSLRKAMPY